MGPAEPRPILTKTDGSARQRRPMPKAAFLGPMTYYVSRERLVLSAGVSGPPSNRSAYPPGEQQTLCQMGLLCSRALNSCCAVARAQRFGQNSRFVQPPPRRWLRAAQQAILGGQHFLPLAIFSIARHFFAGGKKKNEAFFKKIAMWAP